MTNGRGRIIDLNGRGPFVPSEVLSAGWHSFLVETIEAGREVVLGADREHACFVLEGEGEAHFEGGSQPLGHGSAIVVPLGGRVVVEGHGSGLRLFRLEMTVAGKTSGHA
jgi:glyoxylate utilization-related uncharacterized protein